MKASELIVYLQTIVQIHGDCNLYHWDSNYMKHIPLDNPKYVTNIHYSKKLANECPEYTENFNNIKNNVIFD